MSAELGVSDLGLAEEVTVEVAVDQVGRLAAALNLPPPAPGDLLPLLWQWCLFTPRAPTSQLGTDGHVRIPEHAPTAQLPRRMFVGGSSERHRPLVVGQPTTRFATIENVQEKAGRSGRLLVVTVGYEVHQGGELALTEYQNIVYRESGSRVENPANRSQVVPEPRDWLDEVTVDSVTLFRFSAATFNAHRIHYDAAYARDIEGYPGLVVHGPLTALLLARTAARELGRELERFNFRATTPLFEGQCFYLTGQIDQEGARLEVIRGDGATAMTATAS